MTSPWTFDSVLVANRGEIARRVIRTVQRLGLKAVAVYSEADASLPFVKEADEAVLLGAAAPAQSYLDVTKVLEAAERSGAQAIHPGYGFLSENADFARAVAGVGLVWIGPSPEAIVAMGDKVAARNLVGDAGVPVAPGTREPVADVESALVAARVVGYPLMVKAAGGGGGIGMSVAHDEEELATAFATAQSRAERFFGNPSILLERYVTSARHVEVQILGLSDGRVVALGERDCSVQRRHQKVAEETPCPVLTPPLRARMIEAAVRAGEAVGYRGAGTVEFLLDPASLDSGGEFYFLEMNARLQVEHPITELVTGIDLVEQQLRIAAGEPLAITQDDIVLSGHAIEARLYSEDPAHDFLPSTGTIGYLREAGGEGIRVDSSLVDGLVVSADYDPMLAKIIGFGADRDEALRRLDAALADTVVLGVRTNREFLRGLLANPDVRDGRLDTGLIERTVFFYQTSSDAVFAIAALALEKAITRDSAWTAYRGWRIGEHRPARYEFRIGDTVTTVSVLDDTVAIADGDPRSARINFDGAFVRLELDGETTTATVLEADDRLWVATADASVDLAILTREQRLADHRAGIDRIAGAVAPDIRTPMPGTVVAVAAKSGDTVEAGQLLVTIEAMKMEHKMLASVSGVVTIGVTQGELVSLDQVVASIDPHKGEAA